MVIDLLKAKKNNEPQAFSCSGVLSKEILRDNAEFIGLVTADGAYRYFEDEVVADGFIHFKIKTVCDRCGKEIEKAFDFKFNEHFIKDSTDAEIYSFSNEKLDLTLAVSECIMMNLSVQMLCDKKCKGLCFSCGANLNEKKCKCKKIDNNAFSALEDIKKTQKK